MSEREAIDRGWYYVIEPDGGQWAPPDQRLFADDGAVLTRRLHGHPTRTEVVDASGAALPAATLVRAAAAVGRALEDAGAIDAHALVTLGPAGTAPSATPGDDGRVHVLLDGPAVASSPSHHPIEALARTLIAGVSVQPIPRRAAPPAGSLPDRPVPRAMFFESLMNTDMPHNDKEISQGVLHMVSPLRGTGTEVVLVNAKMPITGDIRPVHGLDRLEAALAGAPIQFVGITLLEGYWDGVVTLIRTLRSLGCRAHIAVGGVMPSLAPEHVAAHLPEVSFVCRGAGEVFLPALARIVGPTDIDTPFSEAQRAALLDLDGMIAVERAGPGLRLLSGRSDIIAQVPELDRVALDLSHVEPRHLEGGIEINTSRGCIHKCSFCSILGRERYQARSAGSVFDLLASYEDRFRALFGDAIPPNCYRVHISDDDFACDRDRARDFFRALRDTPFRLSSVQVAVGDLCRREGGRLLEAPDTDLLDAITPDCFADHGLPVPRSDYFADHRSRTWSSFLQIGVETYDDREIARLGKGYRRSHIRTIVAELARRGLHMDGYFILSNADTSPTDLVAVFEEVCRLKLRYPEHFHLRFPVVQHLVSYFTAASHRRHVRKGRRHVMVLRDHAAVPGHPELDYPFVDHDEPEDTWVRRTVADRFVTDDRLYTGNLGYLRDTWRAWHDDLPADDPRRPEIGALLRRLDDAPRRLVADALRHATRGVDPAWPGPPPEPADVVEAATRVLGPPDAWLPLLRAALRDTGPLDVVVAPGAPVDAVRAWVASADVPVRLHAPASSAAALAAVGADAVIVVGRDVAVGTPASPPAAAAVRVVVVTPDTLAALGDALSPGSPIAVRPDGRWTAADASRLGGALHRGWPRGTPSVDDPGPAGPTLAIDARGHVGPTRGLGPDGLLDARHVVGTPGDFTSLARHALDRHDATRWPGERPADHAQRTAPARAVIARWQRHLTERQDARSA